MVAQDPRDIGFSDDGLSGIEMGIKAFLKTYLLASTLAATHLLGCLLTWVHISGQNGAESGMGWAVWLLIDLPWTFFIYEFIDSFYPAFIVHLIVGTLWWFLVGVFLRRLWGLAASLVRQAE
jgi:hypothetical protein